LEVLSKEIQGLKNNLNDFLLKLVCDEGEECCMMSSCDTCKNNFDQYIVKKMIDKKKIITWYQWTTNSGRVVKQNFSGKNEVLVYFYSVLIKSLFFCTVKDFIKTKVIYVFS